jgi:hypothetical protein
MYLGDYIEIEKQTGQYTFNCCCVSTGTEFSAEIDPDKRKFFDDFSFPDSHPTACRFLRPLGEERIGCTIHKDSPAQCKYYRCVIMRIFQEDGEEIGRITGTLAIHTDDEKLRVTWNDLRRANPGSGEQIETILKELLAEIGYRVV